MPEEDPKQLAQQRLMVDVAQSGPVLGGVYRHYKGGLYVIVAVSLAEDDLTELVTYRSNVRDTFWTRTRANFLELVFYEGRHKPRFMWVAQ